MKIRPVGADLFHGDERTDVQTDMAQLIVTFRSFTTSPKIGNGLHYVRKQSLNFRRSTVVTKLKISLPKVIV